ncbi:hypothetical protein M427DRAFT_399533 [Gonapodya prolifera JEL478]|uniref:Uncharacterized protein n=1 Tax=Gonapodya prolifera (strain JEL478) TaxID=1344416 RepID=A0A139ATE6_GONPJ|nr:hypothetical protein M427DRAFT_399533 [Gonapodya prolifera JEL478]|eukprot:KXS19989.1 hypothetical protein M427DRAFT_399533 [Gonapodya prolifera JEL478]
MSIHYVGEVLPTKIVCRHGELECFNNAVQLCVRHVYNEQSAGTNLSPNGWFNFVTCISDWDSLLNVQKPEGPGIVENCVRKTGIADFKGATEEIFKCSEGAEGHALLEGSVRTTISRGVTKSCTVHVNRKQRCIFDGGRMYQCSPDSEPASFVRTICQEWGGSSEICHKTN